MTDKWGFNAKETRQIAAAIVVTLSTAFGVGTGVATGSPSDVKAPVVTLTTTERQSMQARVDERLKNSVGGTQTSINQIAYDNGTTIMTLPLPGETQARAIDEPLAVTGHAELRVHPRLPVVGHQLQRLTTRPCGV